MTVKRLQYNAVSSPGSAAQPSLLGVMGGCARCCTEALAEHRQADLALRLPRGLSVVQQPARASTPITTVDIVIPQLPGHLILRYPSCPGPAPCVEDAMTNAAEERVRAVAVAEERREGEARTLRVPRVNPDPRSLRAVSWIAV